MPNDEAKVTGADSDARSQRVELVWNALRGVPDPEIPPVSIVELGMIAQVRIDTEGIDGGAVDGGGIDSGAVDGGAATGGVVVVDLTPTFAGCPALDLIREDIRKAVQGAGEADVKVNVVFDPPWTTDRITEEGRRKLKEFGLAPPGKRCTGGELPDLEKTACPYCDSTNTKVESIFGPTLCRSIHYCDACLQSFEHFKAV